MICKLGPLPESPEFTPDDSWTLLREPPLWGFQLRAIPIAGVTTVFLAVLWIILTPVRHVIGTLTFPLPILQISLSAFWELLSSMNSFMLLSIPKSGFRKTP